MIKYVLTTIVFLILELASIICVFEELGLTTLYILFIEVLVGYSLVKKAGLSSASLLGLSAIGSSSFSISLLAAGFFIAFPGFVSDVLAVAVFIPFVRNALFRFLKPDPQLVSKVVMNQFRKQGMNMFDEDFMKNASSMFGNIDMGEDDDDDEEENEPEISSSKPRKSDRNRKSNVEDAEFKEL